MFYSGDAMVKAIKTVKAANKEISRLKKRIVAVEKRKKNLMK